MSHALDSTTTPRKLEFEFSLSPDLSRKLSRAGAILEKRYGKRVTLEETLEALSESFLERCDPERRTRREIEKARARIEGRKRGQSEPKEKVRAERPAVPSQLKIQALRRDRNQCTFVASTGSRCARKKNVNVFPRTPQVTGLGDLSTLCSQHARA